MTLGLTGSVRYVGKSRLGVAPPLDLKQGGYTQADVGARLDFGRIGVSLDVTNLADVRGNRFSLGNPFSVTDGDQVTPLRPRTLRLGSRRRFLAMRRQFPRACRTGAAARAAAGRQRELDEDHQRGDIAAIAAPMAPTVGSSTARTRVDARADRPRAQHPPGAAVGVVERLEREARQVDRSRNRQQEQIDVRERELAAGDQAQDQRSADPGDDHQHQRNDAAIQVMRLNTAIRVARSLLATSRASSG